MPPSTTTKSPVESLSRQIRTALKAQHDKLRALMDRCEQLAIELDFERIAPVELTRAVARLRIALDVHNTWEELLLEPVLAAKGQHASVRIGQMIDDHVDEHRLMRARLSESGTASLRTTIATLRAHLDAEERYLSIA